MAKAAILGFGTVGSGVYEVIEKNFDSIAQRIGEPLEVKYIVDIRDFPGTPFAEKVIHDFSVVENDPEVTVVAEVIGGATIAYDYTKRALKAGKSVATSNKELVATHGAELIALAKENHVNYMFEASVGGGIPIIRPMQRCMAANDIEEISGILNGTTNYILTKMIHENLPFETALQQAQEKGYAEKDPTADVEGIDAQRKVAILASLAFGKHVYPDTVSAQGITKITLADVEAADALGYVIKLIGHVKREGEKTFAYVAPHLVSKNHMLAGVEDVFNAIMVKGNMVDEVMFYGKGAGKLPTASAVVADMIECAKHAERNIPLHWEDTKETIIAPAQQFASPWFVRSEDGEEALRKALPVQSVCQTDGVTAVITQPMNEEQLTKALRGLSHVMTRMRVL
jgi:homoserine dehydrogenase